METTRIPEPIVLAPRLDAKPWGSTNLSRFGIDLHGNDAIGEAILTAGDVQAIGGRFAGQTLDQIIALDPEHLLGSRGLALAGPTQTFPLLAKLIDANTFLSIQVHPTNDIAPPGQLGKTEAWYVLDAQPGTTVLAGLVEGVTIAEVEASLRSGQSIVPLVRSVPVQPGDMLFLPAGTIHALGSGIVIYEIQQPSFVTYRLEDWGRAREMHIDEGIAALNETLRPEPTPAPLRTATSPPAPAVTCPYFAFERIRISPGESLTLPPDSGPQAITCVSGEAELAASQSAVDLTAGTTAVLFANAGPARIASLTGATLLRSWLGA